MQIYAAENEFCPDGSVLDPTIGCVNAPTGILSSETDLFPLILKLADFLTLIAGGIALILLVYGGIQYSLAMGEEERTNQAKRTIKWSMIGLILSITAFSVVEFVLKNIN